MLTDLNQQLRRTYTEIGKRVAALVGSQDYAVNRSTKPKQCSKGYSCKATCIAKDRACQNPLMSQAKDYASWLKLQVAAGNKLSPPQKVDANAAGITSATPTKKKPTQNQSSPLKSTPPGQALDPQAPPKVQSLLKQNNSRMYETISGVLTGKPPYFEVRDDSAIKATLKAEAKAKGKKAMSAFAEGVQLDSSEQAIVAELRKDGYSDERIVAVLVQRQVSFDNTWGRRQDRDQLVQQKLAAVQS